MMAAINWCLVNWWIFPVLSFLGVFAAVGSFFTGLAEAIGRGIGAMQRPAQVIVAPSAPAFPTPGKCVHRNVKQIRTGEGELVGWQCQKLGCETRLPPDWAVAAEDLPAPGAEPPAGWVE